MQPLPRVRIDLDSESHSFIMWGQGVGLGGQRGHGHAVARPVGTPRLETLSEEDEADVMDDGEFIKHLGSSMGSKDGGEELPNHFRRSTQQPARTGAHS